MRHHAPGETTRNGYDDNSETRAAAIGRKPPKKATENGRRRRKPNTITDVQVAHIETVTMTPAEETEAIHALAALIADYWRTHPDTG